MLQTERSTTNPDGFVRTLLASQRAPDIAAEDDIYGFLIGSWELQVESHDDNGVTRQSVGEAHVARILEGRAVQDVFINPRRTDRDPLSPRFANWFGTTIRVYDATARVWRVSWFNPHDGVRAELTGRSIGDSVVQEGTFPDGTKIRWTYSEIQPDSCRWRGERAQPDGTWYLQVEFYARRMR